MNRHYEEPEHFDPSALAAGSVLALVIAMTISLGFDIQPPIESAASASAGDAVAADS
jgi:hypothetical protein